jgi:S-adenosylmethionine hydrolase
METGRRGAKTSSRPVSSSAKASHSAGLITLLTDFGAADYFVAAMKGVILTINPNAIIVDLTHEVPAQDIPAAAFTLRASYRSFPAGTIHMAVVDPGVGSSRRPILGVGGSQFFVGPDNGIFSYVFELEPDVRVFELTKEKYFRQPVSATFHGRDVFAPVAAALSNGVRPESLGTQIDDPIVLPSLEPERLGEGKLRGRIVHIDHFGNCITNFAQRDFAAASLESRLELRVGRQVIRSFRQCFSEAGAGNTRDKLFAIWGSAGFLELAAMNQSAAELLKAKIGQIVLLSVVDKTKN